MILVLWFYVCKKSGRANTKKKATKTHFPWLVIGSRNAENYFNLHLAKTDSKINVQHAFPILQILYQGELKYELRS